MIYHITYHATFPTIHTIHFSREISPFLPILTKLHTVSKLSYQLSCPLSLSLENYAKETYILYQNIHRESSQIYNKHVNVSPLRRCTSSKTLKTGGRRGRSVGRLRSLRNTPPSSGGKAVSRERDPRTHPLLRDTTNFSLLGDDPVFRMYYIVHDVNYFNPGARACEFFSASLGYRGNNPLLGTISR